MMTFKKILVAYDGSPQADRAFDSAVGLARQFQASLRVVSVAVPPEPPEAVETRALLESASEHYEEAFKKLRARAQTEGVGIETDVLVGHPADQIVHHAAERQSDLIVMGHRGKSRLQRWLLGSVSKRVMSYAPCSVLVVR